MRLTDEQVVDLLLHPDQSVRRMALFALSVSRSPRTDVLPKATAALDQYGRSEAFRHRPALAWMHPAEESLPWLAAEWESLPPWEESAVHDHHCEDENCEEHGEHSEEDVYRDQLSQLLFKYSPAQLRPYAERLSQAPSATDDFRLRLQFNIDRESATAQEAWQGLLNWRDVVIQAYAEHVAQSEAGEDEELEDFDPPEAESASAWSDILLRNTATAPRAEIIEHFKTMVEQDWEYPENILLYDCLQSCLAARTWHEVLPILAEARESQNESINLVELWSILPWEDVRQIAEREIASQGGMTMETSAMINGFRNPDAAAAYRAWLSEADNVITAGMLIESLCCQFDTESFEVAAEVTKQRDATSFVNWQLLGTATALGIEHPDKAEWEASMTDEAGNALDMTNLIFKDMMKNLGDGYGDGNLESLGSQGADINLDFEQSLQLAHNCGPGCNHDHGHAHHHHHADDEEETHIEPIHPETFRHDTIAVGRNEPCPCGSGKKFKKCCMRV